MSIMGVLGRFYTGYAVLVFGFIKVMGFYQVSEKIWSKAVEGLRV